MGQGYYDPATYEPDKQRPRSSRTEQAADRLSDRAERLLAQSMAESNTHKHKWATGKEKWQALQADGAKAAGVTKGKRGRPAAAPPTPEALLAQFVNRLTLYQTWVIGGTYGPMQLGPERLELIRLRNNLVAMGLLDPQLVVLSVATLDQ